MTTYSIQGSSCAREKNPFFSFQNRQENVINGLHACKVSDNSASLYILLFYYLFLKPSELSLVQFTYSCMFVHVATYCELIQPIIKYFIT